MPNCQQFQEEKMQNGYGRGWRGRGLGFRGESPPRPYVGLGRGGLPRCEYFAEEPFTVRRMPISELPPDSFFSEEDQLVFLRRRADIIKREIENIESRIRSLEET
jgi:hypothetical protein